MGAQKTGAGWGGEGRPCSVWEGVFLGLGTRQCPGQAPVDQSVCTSFRGLAVAGHPLSVISKPEYTAGA